RPVGDADAFLVELFKHFFVGNFFVHQFSSARISSMRFFAINLASKGTARLSILPLSWATMSCAFQAIPEREASGSLPELLIHLAFRYAASHSGLVEL
ncbi:hypothetical protein ACVGAP_004837, partial [Salmonella enterica subsp. enterica serovar Dublin]